VIFPSQSPSSARLASLCCAAILLPDGAIIKPSAATPALMKHRGRAVVFENIEDFHKRIDDPKLDIDERCVMVLKNCGPRVTRHGRVGNMPCRRNS